MQTKQPWYITLRAEALAIVYLTERDDLIVSQQQQNTGLDLLVTITKNGNYSARLFGVELKAVTSSSELIQAHNIFKLQKNRFHKLEIFRDLPFPICLFFFTLDNDKGYYKWILEPITKEQDSVHLHFNENEELKSLDNQEIDNIIFRVNSWYDNRNKST